MEAFLSPRSPAVDFEHRRLIRMINIMEPGDQHDAEGGRRLVKSMRISAHFASRRAADAGSGHAEYPPTRQPDLLDQSGTCGLYQGSQAGRLVWMQPVELV
jgi:hypothetical protein